MHLVRHKSMYYIPRIKHTVCVLQRCCNAIVKSSLFESFYIINQEKTPLEKDAKAAMLRLSLYEIILP